VFAGQRHQDPASSGKPRGPLELGLGPQRVQPWRRGLRSPLAPVALVLLVYGIWLSGVALAGHDARDFIFMGRRYVLEPHRSPLFPIDPHYHYSRTTNGYDGQFAFYIAADPVNARFHVDRVNYRYTRILYPMLVRGLSLGHVALMPYLMIAINLAALAGGTFVLAIWLRRKHLSIWIALLYGLSPGLFVCLQRDLEEPLAYGLVALGMYLLSYGPRGRPLWSGLAFALAALTRESTAVFPAVVGLGLIAGGVRSGLGGDVRQSWRQVGRAGVVLAVALLPFVLYKVFLRYWLGPVSTMAPNALYPQIVPFSGLFATRIWTMLQVDVIVAVIIPALLCAAVALWALWKRQTSIPLWLLLVNVQLFVVMLNRLSYGNIMAAGRITTGVLLAAILSIPTFDRATGRNRAWLWLSAAFWFAAWPALIPFGAVTPSVADLLLGFGGVLAIWAARSAPAVLPAWTARTLSEAWRRQGAGTGMSFRGEEARESEGNAGS